MITSTSKNNSILCVEELCEAQINNCLEAINPVQERIHPIRKFLHEMLVHFLLFLGTDRWEDMISPKVGDSRYMRMDDIQNRWRHM